MTTATSFVECSAPADEERQLAALMANAPASVGQLFRKRCAQTPDALAYQTPGAQDQDPWQTWTWAQAGEVVTGYAAGLLALGLESGQRVAIMADTRMEWIFMDLAVLCAGGATTTIYPTSHPDDVAHILRDSGSSIVVVETAEQRDLVVALKAPHVRAVVTFEQSGESGTETKGGRGKPRVHSLASLLDLGRQLLAASPTVVDERTSAVAGADLATVIYTSGTTGKPKGVRLSNRAWVAGAMAASIVGVLEPEDQTYLWLPLSHVFGKILIASQLAVGHRTFVDGRVDKISENLALVKPSMMGAAPRIFEKVHARVQLSMQEAGGVKLRLFRWAFAQGFAAADLRDAGREPGTALRAKVAVADKLIFSKLRERLGNNIRLFLSGSAPLNRDIARWFEVAGMPILEGYGLTESGSAALNRLGDCRLGTVGRPLPGMRVRIAADGEILLSGLTLMDGYHELPEETAATLSADGWLHTGDIGEITDEGYLKITDRKKDLIKTSNGKYVAPTAVESLFKARCPLASAILVHGERRPFITALIALDPEALSDWAARNDRSAVQDLTSDPLLVAEIEQAVALTNQELPRWEQIKKFRILAQDLSIEGGFLTPSMKMKRRIIEAEYADQLDSMYA